MTIDEAIKHCEEVAELNEECTRIYNEQGDVMASCSCNECAEEHRQLAEWLKELKKYSKGYNDALNVIRAEILEEKECAYADFERYKVEYLGQDWEDAYDSLPQDDFRYGMARCIEIIDKYKGEKE